jgi:hypothetical protein
MELYQNMPMQEQVYERTERGVACNHDTGNGTLSDAKSFH